MNMTILNTHSRLLTNNYIDFTYYHINDERLVVPWFHSLQLARRCALILALPHAIVACFTYIHGECEEPLATDNAHSYLIQNRNMLIANETVLGRFYTDTPLES